MESTRQIHWPACFWFMLAIISAGLAIADFKFQALLQVAGFACMGYSSIRLLPADYFTRRLSFRTWANVHTDYRPIDMMIQCIGLVLLGTDIIVRLVLNA